MYIRSSSSEDFNLLSHVYDPLLRTGNKTNQFDWKSTIPNSQESDQMTISDGSPPMMMDIVH